jgi:hypothetical protein
VPVGQGQARWKKPYRGAFKPSLIPVEPPCTPSAPDAGLHANAALIAIPHAIIGLAESVSWRAILLGTVAGGALLVSGPWPAKAGPGACTNVAPTATCQGDQSAGIASGAAAPPADFPDTFTTLHVNNLTTDITPAANVDGIYLHGTTSVTINSDTGQFSIFITGSEAFGIEAAGSSVTITHMGDIASDSIGNASSGIATVVSQGDITLTAGTADRILAEGLNGVSVTHTGNLTANFRGISAGTPTGTVRVVSMGNIVVNNDSLSLGVAGIYADGTGRQHPARGSYQFVELRRLGAHRGGS